MSTFTLLPVVKIESANAMYVVLSPGLSKPLMVIELTAGQNLRRSVDAIHRSVISPLREEHHGSVQVC